MCKSEHYFGGCSSPLSQPVTFSVFSGSEPSQSKHWNVRGPSPPGGSARIRKAPQPGQVGRSAWPMDAILPRLQNSSIKKADDPSNQTSANSVLLTEHLNLEM